MRRTWLDHERFGLFPEEGGYNGQDPQLVEHDWGLLDEHFGFAFDALWREKNGKGDMLDKLLTDDEETGTWSR